MPPPARPRIESRSEGAGVVADGDRKENIMGEKTGKVTEAIGRVTGDRKVEAKGRVERHAADLDDSAVTVTDEAVEAERQVVRREHRDTGPNPS